mmetsp:Transcript_24605/g.71160  ORF Transcript_24605/g.71160 Transcript_24605/m.71160 type:complete len:335 (+) Transcript_24605:444-1448(+)
MKNFQVRDELEGTFADDTRRKLGCAGRSRRRRRGASLGRRLILVLVVLALVFLRSESDGCKNGGGKGSGGRWHFVGDGSLGLGAALTRRRRLGAPVRVRRCPGHVGGRFAVAAGSSRYPESPGGGRQSSCGGSNSGGGGLGGNAIVVGMMGGAGGGSGQRPELGEARRKVDGRRWQGEIVVFKLRRVWILRNGPSPGTAAAGDLCGDVLVLVVVVKPGGRGDESGRPSNGQRQSGALAVCVLGPEAHDGRGHRRKVSLQRHRQIRTLRRLGLRCGRRRGRWRGPAIASGAACIGRRRGECGDLMVDGRILGGEVLHQHPHHRTNHVLCHQSKNN